MAVARNVEIILTIDDKGSAKVRKMRRTVETEAQKMKRAAQKNFTAMQTSLAGNLNGMTSRFLSFAKFGTAIFGTIATGAIVKFGSSFEKSMSGVKAVTSATGRQMEVMTTQARDLGATTVFTAVQAAEAMEELGKAGFTTSEIIGTMPDVLNLAAAGTLDMAEAASIASDVIRIMGLDVTEFKDATDIMTKTAISSKTTIQELGFAYQDAAPLARALGVTFKDLNVLMGTLANRGFVATRSGTALRRVFAVFLGDLEEGEKGLGDFNVELQRNEDGTVDLVRTFEMLVEAGADANDMMEAFGLRGGPAALNLANALGVEVDGLAAALDDFAGTAGAVANTRLDNLAGDGKILLSTMQELALTFFDQVGPGLRTIAQGATDVIREWTGLIRSSEVVEGLETLWKLGKVAAVAYAITIGVGLVTSMGSFVISAGAAIGSIFATNAAMLASIPIIKTFTAATITAKLAMGGIGAIAALLAIAVGKALLQMTGLGNAFDTAAVRARKAEAATQGLADSIANVEAEVAKIADVTPEGGIMGPLLGEMGTELDDARDALADLSKESEAFVQLRNDLVRAGAKGTEANQFDQLLTEAKKASEQAFNEQAAVQKKTTDMMRLEYEKVTEFALKASDDQKRAFILAYEDAGLGAATMADQIALAFELMAERTKTAADSAAEAERKAAEAAKELGRQVSNLEDIFSGAGLATTEMGDALAKEIVQAFDDVAATGRDGIVVVESFGEEAVEMVGKLELAGEKVDTVLYQVAAAFQRIENFRRGLTTLSLEGEDNRDLVGPRQEPDAGDSGIPEDDMLEEQLAGMGLGEQSPFLPPEDGVDQWSEFWDSVEERSTSFLETIGDGFANLFAGAVDGFANVVGAIATGQVSIKDGFGALFKGLIKQAIGFLVKWGIQRLITSRINKTAQATETAQSTGAGVAETGVNMMKSMSAAPWPINLTAPAWAASYMAIAAGFAAAANASTIAGAAAEGGIIKRRSFIEVGEGSQEEAIIPLRGGHADRVRKELFRGQDLGGGVTVVNNFNGDNWREGGIDDELGERILESIDGLILRGRGDALSMETR